MTVQLVDILREEAVVSAEDLDRAAHQQGMRGGAIAEWLVRDGKIGEDDLFFLMSRRLGVAAIPEDRLLHLTISPELRRRVPRAMAVDCMLLPLDLDPVQGTLSVAMLDPSDPHVLERLRATSRVAAIRPYLARRSAIIGALDRLYVRGEGQDPSAPPPLPIDGPAHEKRSVEVIRGKVEIDADLAQEIAVLKEVESVAGSSRMASSADDTPNPEMLEQTAHPPTRGGRQGASELEPTALVSLEPVPASASSASAEAGPLRSSSQRWMHELPPELPPEDQPEEDLSPLIELVDPEKTGELEIAGVVELESATPDEDAPSEDPRGVSAAGHRQSPIVDSGVFDTPSPEIDWDPDDAATGVIPVSAVLDESPEVPLLSALPDDIAGLLGELVASVGVLVAMLEERVDPGGATSREYARLCRLVARELGLDGLAVDRITVAGHLFGLDIALRLEVDSPRCGDVREVFAVKPTRPGGLNPTLRSLGACAIGVFEPGNNPIGVAVIRIVADYLDLRAESEEESSETVVQLLRASGTDPALIEALLRVVEEEETLVETRRSKLSDRR